MLFLFGAKSEAICLCLVLRRYLIELNTTNPIQIKPLNLTQSYGVSCLFGVISTDLTCFGVKIFVFCARIKLKGVDRIEMMY